MSGFNGLSLEVEKPAKMEITHPATGVTIRDESGNAAYIEVLSTDSDVAQKRRKQSKKRLMDQIHKGKKTNYSIEQSEEDDIETLVSLTVGWRLMDLNGKPIEEEYNEDNARYLYSANEFLWLRTQVEEFVSERGNFTNS